MVKPKTDFHVSESNGSDDEVEVKQTETICKVDSHKPTLGLSHLLFPPAALYKAACIDYYIKLYKCHVITSEFRYGTNQLVTDLVLMTSRNIISIEVKSEHDDLRRLKSQVSEARKNFNLTLVFAAPKHKNELLDLLPLDVGITIFENGRCKLIRKPQRNNPLETEIVATIPASFLRTYFKIPQNLDSDQVRLLVINKHRHSVFECLKLYMRHKYSDNYHRFLLDRGERTHIEDIPILNMKNFIDIR